MKFSTYFLTVFLWIIVFPLLVEVQAQPGLDWVQTYDTGRAERFCDIYTVPDNGYVMCGSAFTEEPWDSTADMLAVRIDNDGNEQWQTVIGFENSIDILFSVIETDFGTFMCGGYAEPFPDRDNVPETVVVHLDAEGNQIWLNRYGQGELHAIIELKSGEYIGAGWSNRMGYLICFDLEGNVLWENRYGDQEYNYFFTMRETQGGIVAAGRAGRGAWVAKVDFGGELIWSREHQIENSDWIIDMTSSRNGGFAMSGYLFSDDRRGPHILLMKVGDDGEMEWHRFPPIARGEFRESCPGIVQMEENGFTIVGRLSAGAWGSTCYPYAIRLNSAGVERWHSIYDMEEIESLGRINSNFHEVTIANDGSLIAAGCAQHDDENENGLVMKLEPEILNPIFLHWEPEDTLLEVLEGDTVEFLVRAFDQQDDELSYLWIMGEDSLSEDTTITVIFDELGDFEVQCQVSDGEFTSAITWHVSVLEWYIDGFLPDSTLITIRRGTFIDFSHHVRSINELDFTYSWEHFGRGGNFEFEGEDSARYEFELTGDHIIRAWVMHDNVNRTLEWDINVRSIVWWWWPHEFDISAPEDTTMVFEVFPFNEESDSLDFSWFLNNEALESDTSLIEISFPEIDEFEITAYVNEGMESDTIRWTVNVLERTFTTDLTDLADLPVSPVLYPASPNPFNSSVMLSIYLPKASRVMLTVFDINGREIARLVDRCVTAGNQTFVWNAGDFPTGVYVVHMEAGEKLEMQKIVLMR